MKCHPRCRVDGLTRTDTRLQIAENNGSVRLSRGTRDQCVHTLIDIGFEQQLRPLTHLELASAIQALFAAVIPAHIFRETTERLGADMVFNSLRVDGGRHFVDADGE